MADNIEPELEKIAAKLQAGQLAATERDQLYAAQQALSWASQPDTFKSAYDLIVPASGTLQGSEGCQEENGRSQFLDSPDHRDS